VIQVRLTRVTPEGREQMKKTVSMLVCLGLFLSISLLTGDGGFVAQGSLSGSLSPKIKGDLKTYVDSQENIPVIVAVEPISGQPAIEIEEIKSSYESERERIREEMKQIHSKCRYEGPALPDELEREVTLPKPSEEDQQRLDALNLELESIESRMRDEVSSELTENYANIRLDVQKKVSSLGGKVEHSEYSPPGYLVVEIPGTAIAPLSLTPGVAALYHNGMYPNIFLLDVSAYAINADEMWDWGHQDTVWDCAIVDSGVEQDHPCLRYRHDGSLRTWYEECFLDDEDECDTWEEHGTHCAGIVASSSFRWGQAWDDYRGMAYDIRSMLSAKVGMEDAAQKGSCMQGMFWAAVDAPHDKAEVLSCSWGYRQSEDGVPEDGNGLLAGWVDSLVDNNDVVVVFACGNEGPRGYTLRHPADAYNIISVGAVDDNDTSPRDDDAMASFSSRGPTDDWRKKPDLVAPGVDIKSTIPFTGFNEGDGTSAACPHVAGAALLLKDAGLNPLEIKAVLINTARKMGGAKWDSGYGWGSIDLWHANYHKDDVFTDTVSSTGDQIVYQGTFYKGDTATLVWNRYINVDCSNLNLRLYDQNWHLIDDSITSDENVEQVLADGYYPNAYIKVSCVDLCEYRYSGETFALATEEGFTKVS
jgi:serine protease AprX